VKLPRCSGILLHPASLAAGHGLGDLGRGAADFLDFLEAAGQGLWQMLPIGPTGFGNSPYQALSAFAGNPLLISLDGLVEEGLLERKELRGGPANTNRADYAAVQAFKIPLLERAAERFARAATARQRAACRRFCSRQAGWLTDYALFITLKQAQGGKPWYEWPAEFRDRDPAALEAFSRRHAQALAAQRFEQWVFFRQWAALREACHRRGVRLMGDIPIYAAGDSADVWAHRDLWQLDRTGRASAMAGVPPDYFSATGQLWGNPVYRWRRMAANGFAWWIERFRATFELFDAVRLDHFRGFAAYWEVPGGETTAVRGRWVSGPGARLFAAVEAALGKLNIVAENLGVITSDVEALRASFGFPGMAVLQFAFGNDEQAPTFRPHNFPREVVAYTGTHDNDTTAGWWQSRGGEGSTQDPAAAARERDFAQRYLASDGTQIHWDFIRALQASVANTVVAPAQDLLGLGSEARMNMPSTLEGNWLWRLSGGQLTPRIAARLREMAGLYDRLPNRSA
jgi:4-alpha-glucanotransferase